MQTISTAATRAFQEGLSLRGLPRVIVDWNQNRFAQSVTASVEDPKQETGKPEEKKFPIESIAWANRPTNGMAKAKVNEAKANGQYRTVGAGAVYKYWLSSQQSGTAFVSGYGFQILNSSPSVVYGNAVKTNKIVVKLENSWASPQIYQIQISTDGTTFPTTIATNPAIDSNGVITLYLQANGTWGTTVTRANTTTVRGVRLRVESMTKAGAHLGVIEVAACYERDISEDVISVSIDKSLSDADLANPVGVISSNSADITLDTTTRNYDVEYVAGPYYGLLDANAEVRVELGVDTTEFGGTGMEYIPQGTFFSDAWAINSEATTVSLSCTDASKFLQDSRIMPGLFIGKRAPYIIREILKRAGVNNFVVPDDSTEPILPYVWFNEEDTVWSALASICRATNGMLFYDELGRPTYLSKNALYSKLAGAENYRLSAILEAPVQPNIENISHEYDTEINKVTITYSPRVQNKKEVRIDRKTPTGGNAPTYFDATGDTWDKTLTYTTTPINSVLWSPEGTVALQASRLAKPMGVGDTSIWVTEEAARTWPFIGKVNIEGEVMTYTGKIYKSFLNGAARYQSITSQEQKKAIDEESDLATRSQNRFTGELKNVLRGRDGTEAKAHTIDIQGWSHYLKRADATVTTTSSYTRQEHSSMVLMGPNLNNTYESYLMSSRGSVNDIYTSYGTRMRFANIQSAHATAGIFFHQQADRKQGYYVEFNTTRMAVSTLKGSVNNIRVYRMNEDGTRRHLPNTVASSADDAKWTKGVEYNIVPGQWFNVDVTYHKEQARWSLYVNGQRMVDWIDEYGNRLLRGNWGVFTRGHSGALFEYFYVNNTSTPPQIEDSAFIDKVTGAFTSGYADREVHRSSKNKVEWFFDEFGPYVHEIREFDVEFDKTPAVRPFIYISNDWDAYHLGTRYTPFGAVFEIANAGRDVAILNGDDTGVVFGETVAQKMMVYGQLVIEEQTKSHTVKNEAAIRRRGEIVLEVDSKWIQTEAHAKDYGEFIVSHWGEPADNIDADIFINPALQLGDLVTVNWPERSMTPATHKYFVSSINISYDNGIKGSVSLRRAR